VARSRLPGAVLRTSVVIVGGGLTLWLSTIALIIIAGEWPVLRQADAIVVLGAAQYNGRPSPVLQARLDHALGLYDRGLAARMVFTGGVGVGDTLSEGEVSRRYAVRHGVPESAILVERHGTTSAASVAAAARLMRAEGLVSALIVSDSYHMMRLELLMRRAGIRPYRAPAVNAPIDLATRRTRWYYILRESVLFPAAAVLGGT
jgi:uncharacterized SAM-binding protein YcdF (DUF218 family)